MGYLKYNEPMTEADVRTDLGENLDDLPQVEKQRIQNNREQCIWATHYVRSLCALLFFPVMIMSSQWIANWMRYHFRTKKRDPTILPAVREFNRTLREIIKPTRATKQHERYAEMYAVKLAPKLSQIMKDTPREKQMAAREAFLQHAFRQETSEVRQEVLLASLAEQVAEDTVYRKQFHKEDREVVWAR
jgi:hypothetical protein